jgi:hypothetical protein
LNWASARLSKIFGIKTLASECPNEALGKAVLPRTTGLYEQMLYALGFKKQSQCPSCKLGSIVGAKMLRSAIFGKGHAKGIHDGFSGHLAGDLQNEALAARFVHNGEAFEVRASCAGIVAEIETPHIAWMLG